MDRSRIKVSVSPEAFFPRPKVRSTVLKIELFPKPLVAPEEISFGARAGARGFWPEAQDSQQCAERLVESGRGEIESFLHSKISIPDVAVKL